MVSRKPLNVVVLHPTLALKRRSTRKTLLLQMRSPTPLNGKTAKAGIATLPSFGGSAGAWCTLTASTTFGAAFGGSPGSASSPWTLEHCDLSFTLDFVLGTAIFAKRTPKR